MNKLQTEIDQQKLKMPDTVMVDLIGQNHFIRVKKP